MTQSMICMMCGKFQIGMIHMCNGDDVMNHVMSCVQNSSENGLKLVSNKKLIFNSIPPEKNKVAIVFGTYNRIKCLQNCIASIFRVKGNTKVELYIIDGGSTDGTIEWIKPQLELKLNDFKINLIEQKELTGAVKAFNLGFDKAIEDGHEWICHLNDDAEFITPEIFEKSISLMLANNKIGEVAFEFDLFKKWAFCKQNGKVYANYGLIRAEAAKDVIKHTKNSLWNTAYKTYGADGEFGLWLWKLGWTIEEGIELRVHDNHHNDELRKTNFVNQSNEINTLISRTKEFEL